MSGIDSTTDPLTALVRQHMERRGLDRAALGKRLAAGGNVTKAFRRLDEVLKEERYLPEVVQRVADALQIPAEQLSVAWEAHDQREREALEEETRRAEEMTMARRGPHLWGILPPRAHPCLITVLGAEYYLLVRLPEEIADLADFEQMQEVGRIAREHYEHHRRCPLDGYEYRRSLQEVFRFGVDGQCEGRVEGGLRDVQTFVQFGRRRVETTRRGMFSNPPEQRE